MTSGKHRNAIHALMAAEAEKRVTGKDEAITVALNRLADARQALFNDDPEEADTAILDVMDQLTGWCSKRVSFL